MRRAKDETEWLASKRKAKPPTYTAEVYRSTMSPTLQGKVLLGDQVIGWTKPTPAGQGATAALLRRHAARKS